MIENRKFPKGTIFKFSFGIFILAAVGAGRYNLIDLANGHFKTEPWGINETDFIYNKLVEIPADTWKRGGPPVVLKLGPDYTRDHDFNDYQGTLDIIMKHLHNNLNDKVIESIQGISKDDK